jgi:lipoprotein-releasing system permease protein
MNTNLQIAKTHLLSKKRQSLIAMLGVMFGIAMFTLMISVMTGVNDFLEETMLTSTPHIHLYKDLTAERKSIADEVYTGEDHINIVAHQKPKDEKVKIRNAGLIVDAIRADPRVLGVSPSLTTQVFYNYGPVQISGLVEGVNIEDENKLFDLKKKIKSGVMEDLLTTNDGILMGRGLAKKLNVQVGDRLNITTPLGALITVKIVGTYAYGVGAIDNVKSYASLKTVQKLLKKDSRYITDIKLKLNDLNSSKKVAAEYASRFGYKAEDWETANATVLLSFTIRNIMTVVVVSTLLIVAGFGIYNIMSMTINNKLKDIAILKATGFAGRDIVEIFLGQSIIIGVLGAIIGIILGFSLSVLISRLPFDGGEILAMDHFPVNFKLKFYAFGIFFGIVTTAIAGYFPARKAAKIDPVVILRG